MDFITDLLPGVEYTVLITLAAFAIGIVGGVPLVLLRRSHVTVVAAVTRLVIDLVRSIPPITWLFLIYFGLPNIHVTLDPVPAAIVGLGVISAAYMAEIYRAGLLAISRGQWEAARALGLGEVTLMVRVVAPQALRVVGPPAATYAIGLLKDTAIASTIGVQEITFRANAETVAGGQGLQYFATAAVIYIVLSLPFAVFSRRVDRRMRARFTLA